MRPPTRCQRGSALLLILALVLVGVLGLLLGILNRGNPQIGQQRATVRALAEARQAVIAWSASNDALPGQLPCPEDTTLIGAPGEGSAMSSCTLPALGRLPWRTLGLAPLRDAAHEPLWYAVSAGFRAAPINSASVAQLTVDGIANSAVAIVFAPGPALAGQLRLAPSASAPPLPVNYLDGVNGAGGNSFSSAASAGAVNDQLALLTRADLMRVVQARVTGELALRLRAYYRANFHFPFAAAPANGTCVNGVESGYLPLKGGSCTHPEFPASLGAPLDTLPAWYGANNWQALVAYRVGSGCLQPTPGRPPPAVPDCGGPGRLTVGGNSTVKATLAINNTVVVITP